MNKQQCRATALGTIMTTEKILSKKSADVIVIVLLSYRFSSEDTPIRI